MKKTFQRLFNRMLSNKGYTIDQTILIVAIIAILITLVIITVGWQLINRTSGTKAGAQFKQVEDANGTFFSDQRVWPHQGQAAATPTATSNMAILTGAVSGTDLGASINKSKVRNQLPGFKVTGTGPSAVTSHNFGNGGAITQMNGTYPASANVGTDNRLVIQFASVPLNDAKEADIAIDGAEGYNTGRLIYRASTNCLPASAGSTATVDTTQPTSANVNVCYAANTI